MDMPVQDPTPYSRVGGTRPETIGGENGLSDGSNTFNAFNFVVYTAGALAAIASAATSACGLVPDKSNGAGNVPNPPSNFFGGNHFPFSLVGMRFIVSITDSAGHIGQANGAPTLSAITKGNSYGVKLVNGVHMLNKDDTTNLFFTVVDIPSQWGGTKQDSTVYNPVVIVEVVSAAIQKIA